MPRADLHARRPRFGPTPEQAALTDRPGVCPIGGTRQEPLPDWARAGVLWLRDEQGFVERIVPRHTAAWRDLIDPHAPRPRGLFAARRSET